MPKLGMVLAYKFMSTRKGTGSAEPVGQGFYSLNAKHAQALPDPAGLNLQGDMV